MKAITMREHATIIAGLRYWQREGLMSSGAEHDIASEADTLTPLTAGEIDSLVERLNFGEGYAIEQSSRPPLCIICDEDSQDMPWCHYCDCWHMETATHIGQRTVVSTLEGIKTVITHDRIERWIMDHASGKWQPATFFQFDQLILALDGLNSYDKTQITVAAQHAPGRKR